MTALELKQVRKFMHTLLLTDAFDFFCVAEARIVTFAEFTIDGTFHPEFFENGEEEAAPPAGQLVRWEQLRGTVFSLIRGKHAPLSFRIVFQLPEDEIASLIQDCGSSLSPEDVKSLSLNCIYRGGSLLLTSGSSITAFTKERTLERAWDTRIVRFLQKIGIE